MKVVFLDFDGVLNSEASCIEFQSPYVLDHSCMRALNHIIKETEACIVVSSTWRIGKSLRGLTDILLTAGLTLGTRVFDVTPVLHVKRGLEIQKWLDQAKETGIEVEAFVIIDDDSDMEHLLPYLVKTNNMDGLIWSKAKEAIKLLTGKDDDSRVY